MKPLDLLITSPYFWPELSGTAPYVTGLADYLDDRGHHVTVVTGFPHYPAWKPARWRDLAAAERRGGVDVRRRRHYVPRRQSALRRALYEASLFSGGLTALGTRRPDVIVGFTPALSGALLAATASTAFRRPYVLIFHDLMGSAAEQSGVRGGPRVARRVRRLETALARRASRVAVISDQFRPYLEEGGVEATRIVRVRTWTLASAMDETVGEARARLGWPTTAFVCLYAGSTGHKQALNNIIQTAALVSGDRDLQFAIAGDGSERGHLQRMAHELGLPNVNFLAPQPTGLYESMLRAADVLLVNQRASLSDMALPSKLTSYFAAGRPVVAAVAADSGTAAEVESSGGGMVVAPEDPAALAEAIRLLRADPERAARLGAEGVRYAEERLRADVALAEYEAVILAAVGMRGSDG